MARLRLSKEHEQNILKYHAEGMHPAAIKKALSITITLQGIKSSLIRLGVTPNTYVAKKNITEKSCKGCGKQFVPKDRRSKNCSVECGRISTMKAVSKYTQEDINKVIELKKQLHTNSNIQSTTGVRLSKIKEIVRDYGLELTPDQRQINARKSQKSDHMANMRESITKESYEKTSKTLLKTFSDPKYKEIFSKSAMTVWANLRKDPKKLNLMIHKRSRKSQESNLGMSIAEYDEILQKIKQDIENKQETAQSASVKYGVCSTTVYRRFNEKNWGHLLNKMVSKGQLDVHSFVETHYKGEITLSDRARLNGRKELDIYIPELKFGIEYDGIIPHSTCWEKPSSRLEKDSDPYFMDLSKGRHTSKYRECLENGIQLLAMFSDEWEHPVKRKILESMILFRLKKLKITAFRPSSLELRRLNNTEEYSSFFEQNHLEGNVGASFAYGYFYEKELIFCASFGKGIFTNGQLEIKRLASKIGFQVHGGLGKILKIIGKPVTTYSNNRLSSGGIYLSSGFKEITQTKAPSYWYTDGVVRIWRFKCKRLNDPEILAKYPTEKLQARNGIFSAKIFGDSRPLYKIEDYGSRKWIWTPKEAPTPQKVKQPPLGLNA